MDLTRIQFSPLGVLSGNPLEEKVLVLSKNLARNDIISFLPAINNVIIPDVFIVNLSKNAQAKTHRTIVSDFLKTSFSRQTNILSSYTEDSIIVKVLSEDYLDEVQVKIKEASQPYAISCLDSFVRYAPDISDTFELGTYRIELLDFLDEQQNKDYRKIFLKLIETLKISYKELSFFKGFIVYFLTFSSVEQLRDFKSSPILKYIKQMQFSLVCESALDTATTATPIEKKFPDPKEDYAVLGVLDSGISDNDYLFPWIKKHETCPHFLTNSSHGTAVASVALYGDFLEEKMIIGGKGFKVLDAMIYYQKIPEYELLENIKSIVKKHHKEIKIWNLSISIDGDIRPGEYSTFAKALDSIQDEFDILICKSAGNVCIDKDQKILQHGAESLRSLTVGAVAHLQREFDIACIGAPSPFSAGGPGPNFEIKPEVAHWGGNGGHDLDGKTTSSGVLCLSVDGEEVEYPGTSFATPRISALATELFQSMDKNFDALLLKALIVHSANFTSFPETSCTPENKIQYLGFGVPQNINSILYDDQFSSTLVMRDFLKPSDSITINEFPIPDCLIQKGHFTGKITITLITKPQLEPSQGRDYCQSELDIKFGTYSNLVKRDTTKRTVRNPYKLDASQNFLLASFVSDAKVHDNYYSMEKTLRNKNFKYCPIKKYSIDMSKFQKKHMQFLDASKKWYLKLTPHYKQYVSDKKIREKIEFCLIVTISDLSEKQPVNARTIQKLNAENFEYNRAKIREHETHSINFDL